MADERPRSDSHHPVIAPGHTFGSVTDKISAIVADARARRSAGSSAFAIAFALADGAAAARSTWLFVRGVGIWGINIPVGWGFAIINFVWWIGIGHAGTLISAILLLLQPAVAHLDQPLRRGDDALRRGVRAACSRSCTLGRPVAASTGCCPTPTRWACGRSSAARWCGTSSPSRPTCTVSLAVLVHRADPRPGDPARPGHQPRGQASSTASSSLGWRGSAATGSATRRAYLLLAGLATPLVRLGAHHRELRLRRRPSCPAGTRRSSRRTSWPGPSSPASRWC